MGLIEWIAKFVLYPSSERELEKALGTDCKTLLDVGCGLDSAITIFTRKFYSVGIDAYAPYLEKSKKMGIYNEYINMTCSELDMFAPRTFDCVVALEVLEHLKKEEGRRLIDALERIAKKKIIISTPNGFLPQGVLENNPWQIHRSGWTIEEMRIRGYKIIGLSGLRILRGEFTLDSKVPISESNIRFNPKWLWMLVSFVTQYLVRNHPKFAFQILCIKVKK